MCAGRRLKRAIAFVPWRSGFESGPDVLSRGEAAYEYGAATGGVDLDSPTVPRVVTEVPVGVRPPRERPASAHDHFGGDFEILFEVMVQRLAHRAPLKDEQRRERRRDDQQDRCGEPECGGECGAGEPHGSPSRTMNPTPRTVSMSLAPGPWSTFFAAGRCARR